MEASPITISTHEYTFKQVNIANTHFKFPTISPSLVFSEPGKEFTNRHPFVLIRLTLEDQTILVGILRSKVVGRPRNMELVKETSDDQRFAFYPDFSEDLVRKCGIVKYLNRVRGNRCIKGERI